MKTTSPLLSTLAFLASNPGWHSIAKDAKTRRAVNRLESEGFAAVTRHENGTWQARFSGKVFAGY